MWEKFQAFPTIHGSGVVKCWFIDIIGSDQATKNPPARLFPYRSLARQLSIYDQKKRDLNILD
jgi:hypothetical protein